MGYSIFRVSKVKTPGELSKLAKHIERSGSRVPNAREPHDVTPVLGGSDLVKSVKESLPEKYRKDAVLALDFVLTVSPESLRVGEDKNAPLDHEKVKKFNAAATEFLSKEFGECVHAYLHLDETTPHFQGFIVPNKGFKKGESLTAKTLFGPKQLSEYQTKWHETLIRRGLQVNRGEVGSEAEHTSIRDYYTRVNSPIPQAPALVPKLAVPTPESTKARNASKLARAEFFQSHHAQAHAQAKEAMAKAAGMEKRAKNAEAKFNRLKEKAAELRSLPLVDVLNALGCEKHSEKEPLRWRTPAGDVWIEDKGGNKFNSFDDGSIKGSGAIDLVMKINGQNFDQAASWLASSFGVDAVASDAAAAVVDRMRNSVKKAAETVKEPTPLPNPMPDRLERVRAYLTQARAIPAKLVEVLVGKGAIYADKFANACFLNDKKTGVEIRGTGASSYHGQRGPKDGWTVGGDPLKVAIVESAIEAMSVRVLHGMSAVAMGGANTKKAVEIAREWIARGATVYAAQNNDKDGEKQAQALISEVAEVQRMRPENNDFNDDLKAAKQAKLEARQAPITPRRFGPR